MNPVRVVHDVSPKQRRFRFNSRGSCTKERGPVELTAAPLEGRDHGGGDLALKSVGNLSTRDVSHARALCVRSVSHAVKTQHDAGHRTAPGCRAGCGMRRRRGIVASTSFRRALGETPIRKQAPQRACCPAPQPESRAAVSSPLPRCTFRRAP